MAQVLNAEHLNHCLLHFFLRVDDEGILDDLVLLELGRQVQSQAQLPLIQLQGPNR